MRHLVIASVVLGASLVAAPSRADEPAAEDEWHGTTVFSVGDHTFDSDRWSPVQDQLGVSLQVDFGADWWMNLLMGIGSTVGEADYYYTDTAGDTQISHTVGKTVEMMFGVKTPPIKILGVSPGLSAGGVATLVTVDGRYTASTEKGITESGNTIVYGGFVQGDISYTMRCCYVIGLYGRAVSTNEGEIPFVDDAVKMNASYFAGGLRLGYRW